MGTLKEYQCNGCCYTVTGTRKGRTLGMMGEIETEKFRGNVLNVGVT